jgi:murein DD-endopeptidase
MKKYLLIAIMIIVPFMTLGEEQAPGAQNIDKTKFVKQLMLREKIVKIALSLRGVDYWYGSEDPDFGLDCSAFTQYVYHKAGINIPRTSKEQLARALQLARPSLQKGDLVFFATRGFGVNHVGIYIGNDQFIHSPRVGEVVKIDSLNDRFYKLRFLSGGSFIY